MSGNIENKTVIFGEVKGPIKVDPTLTHEGEAADAFVVGESIKEIKECLGELKPTEAQNVVYDNAYSQLGNGDVQSAIDEVSSISRHALSEAEKAVEDARNTVNETMSGYLLKSDKPDGVYTGNGGKVEQNIEINGTGNILAIYANPDVTTPIIAFVTKIGAILFEGTSVRSYLKTSIKFEDGVLTVGASVNIPVNRNGVEYYFQVL